MKELNGVEIGLIILKEINKYDKKYLTIKEKREISKKSSEIIIKKLNSYCVKLNKDV